MPTVSGRALGTPNKVNLEVRNRIESEADPVGFLIQVIKGLSINFEVRQSGFVALLGGSVSESFSWSSVELSSDVIAIVLSD